ncbi:MAG: hypothetical protein M1837_004530 [Sclerophora amabilis]|nr:MAG: hypothetical protein M1837_004530 [Sclerophora amabilis]
MTIPTGLNDGHFLIDSDFSPHDEQQQFPGPMNQAPTVAPRHPLGIKPSGNAYTSNSNLRAASGLFALLPEELIVQLLEFLDASDLLSIGSTCKALYAYARLEDLWKALFIRCFIPKHNSIPRLQDLTDVDFATNWTNKPFILTSPIREWPMYRSLSTDKLIEQYGHVKFRAEAVDWTLVNYVQYMENNQDESPLYLFDRNFVEKMGLTVSEEGNGDYWPPRCFGEDLFATLGEQRPDSRWLIVGPGRSGSTFHKDPNATSAWNAVLKGAKYWIMFPSSDGFPPPPGVYVSEDQSEVTSPLSIAEWLLGFHAEARKTKGCLEGICKEGEVLHVPSGEPPQVRSIHNLLKTDACSARGWWHLVVNLETSIAITQNFIPEKHLSAALTFLRDKPSQVSGFKAHVKDPYGTFVQRLRERHPELLDEALVELSKTKEGKKRKWDELVHGEAGHGVDQTSETFSFGFDGLDNDDKVIC